MGPVTSGKIRSIAIEVPSNAPSKIMASKDLDSISLFEDRLIKIRATKMKVAHIALAQTGFASPDEMMTIAAESQVATAKELSRKSN
jgi:hypothetical protein